jgi:glycosyl transferase family 10 (putative fucosyltransferase)
MLSQTMRRQDVIRVGVAAGWTNAEEAFRSFLRYAEDETGRWRDLRLTNGEHDVLLLFNAPDISDYDPATTIVFESEPRSTREAEFRYPYDRDEYLAFYDLERHHFVGEWFVEPQQVSQSPLKLRTLSTITSGIGVLPRHRLRRDFVSHWLRKLPELEDFGRATADFQPRGGELRRKADGLLPYKYTFAAENSLEPNYFTEKLLDALLCETLPFYDGCPNLELFVDRDAFVRVDMSRPKDALSIIRESIDSDVWSTRRDVLRSERERLIIELNPLEIARKLIHGEPTAWGRPEVPALSAGLPICLAPVDPGDRESVSRVIASASHAGTPTLIFDRDGSFLQDADGVIASAIAALPEGGAIVVGGTGTRFPSVSIREPRAASGYRIRRLVPGRGIHASSILITPQAASRLGESRNWPVHLDALGKVRALDPPVFYVPGPHMSAKAERPPVAHRQGAPGWHDTLQASIKRLPRGQRIARGLVDIGWIARDELAQIRR